MPSKTNFRHGFHGSHGFTPLRGVNKSAFSVQSVSKNIFSSFIKYLNCCFIYDIGYYYEGFGD